MTVPNSPVITPLFASKNWIVVSRASSSFVVSTQVLPASALVQRVVNAPTTQIRLSGAQVMACGLSVVGMSRWVHVAPSSVETKTVGANARATNVPFGHALTSISAGQSGRITRCHVSPWSSERTITPWLPTTTILEPLRATAW
mgnify:CR=1 FL=1